MAPNLFERIQAKIELFRLEQRYTRRRHRRSTFVSNAIYVDGEYVYQTPNATGSSTGSSGSGATASSAGSQRVDAYHFEDPQPSETAAEPSMPTPAPKKRLSRFASLTNFGSSGSTQQQTQQQTAQQQTAQTQWRTDR